MTDAIFNSFMFFEKLKDAGVPERQAKVQTEMMQEVVEDKLATKKDMYALELRLDNRIKELELRLNNRIKELELRLTLRLGAIMAASIALVAAIVKI